MYETEQDLVQLQALLNVSYERAGGHLRSIFSPELRLSAAELANTLTGMQLLSLATVTRACEPRVGPVDGLFYRGHFWFGSSEDSVRFGHIRQRPQVSATHTRGEDLAVVVHGRAYIAATVASLAGGSDPDWAGFARYAVEVYGKGWLNWNAAASYARIEAGTMFASRLPEG
ncbi:MAG TPA: pyridoxamine 5'-phosphate oxidase family protein [Chloroflexota bacterium]|nr:pyridoxamine 5'-phosphate oxidase family protein [Chloroflexota bacterium]